MNNEVRYMTLARQHETKAQELRSEAANAPSEYMQLRLLEAAARMQELGNAYVTAAYEARKNAE